MCLTVVLPTSCCSGRSKQLLFCSGRLFQAASSATLGSESSGTNTCQASARCRSLLLNSLPGTVAYGSDDVKSQVTPSTLIGTIRSDSVIGTAQAVSRSVVLIDHEIAT